jgi:type IV secretory pathway TraG/TraD family ATPase VirD4
MLYMIFQLIACGFGTIGGMMFISFAVDIARQPWWTVLYPKLTLILSTVIGCLIGNRLIRNLSNSFFRYELKNHVGIRDIRIAHTIGIFIPWFLIIVCSFDSSFQTGMVLLSPLLGMIAATRYLVTHSVNKAVPIKTRTVYPDDWQPGKTKEKQATVIPMGDPPIPIDVDTSHGSAQWIPDYRKNMLTMHSDNQPGFEGLWLGGGFFHQAEGNLISIAPPGTGKGAALILPNLLWERKYKHSFVVFDPKGTNACISARFQQLMGQRVILIDPMGLQAMNHAKHRIASASFNPLDFIRHDIFNGTGQIVQLMLPDDPKGEIYWTDEARNMLQAALMHLMTSTKYEGVRNLVKFSDMFQMAKVGDLLLEMTENNEFNRLIANRAEDFLTLMEGSEKTYTAIVGTAMRALRWLNNPALRKRLMHSDFSPHDLEAGGVTLYLCQPIHNKEQFAVFSRLIVGFCLRYNSMPSPFPKAWVYYLLDEFPTMGVFPEVIDAMAFSREYRMRLWVFAQSLSQLDDIYKESGRNMILGNAKIFQAFGVTCTVTQNYVSNRIGKTTKHSRTTGDSQTENEGKSYTKGSSSGSTSGASRSFNTGTQSSKSTSTGSSRTTSSNETKFSDFLIAPHEVERDQAIITISEWGPMRLCRYPYWYPATDAVGKLYSAKFLDGRADPNPNIGRS